MPAAEAAWQAVYMGMGLLWTAAWALLLGYAFSAAIQVFVAPEEAADELGGSGPRHLGLAMGVGFVSSSCSFAALAATRALWTKGASLPSALAFLYASTNLVIEPQEDPQQHAEAGSSSSRCTWGAFILVAVMIVLIRLTCPERLAQEARERASQVEHEGAEPSEELPKRWADRLTDPRVGQSRRGIRRRVEDGRS